MGALDPNNIHVPGAFVHRVIQGPKYEKRIEVGDVVTKGPLPRPGSGQHGPWPRGWGLTGRWLRVWWRPAQRLTLTQPSGATAASGKKKANDEDARKRERIVRRAALEFKVRVVIFARWTERLA